MIVEESLAYVVVNCCFGQRDHYHPVRRARIHSLQGCRKRFIYIAVGFQASLKRSQLLRAVWESGQGAVESISQTQNQPRSEKRGLANTVGGYAAIIQQRAEVLPLIIWVLKDTTLRRWFENILPSSVSYPGPSFQFSLSLLALTDTALSSPSPIRVGCRLPHSFPCSHSPTEWRPRLWSVKALRPTENLSTLFTSLPLSDHLFLHCALFLRKAQVICLSPSLTRRNTITNVRSMAREEKRTSMFSRHLSSAPVMRPLSIEIF